MKGNSIRMTKVEINMQELISDLANLNASYSKINDELGAVRDKVTIIDTNQKWFKESLETTNARSWWILGTVVVLGITGIAVSLI